MTNTTPTDSEARAANEYSGWKYQRSLVSPAPTDPAVPDELRNEIQQMFASAWQDGVHHLNPKYLRRDTFFTDRTLALFTQYARQARLDELENLASDKHSDWTREILARRIAQLTATPHEGEEK